MRRLVTLLVVAALAASLSACGRKGRPIEPEGNTYPRRYPNIEFPSSPEVQSEDEAQGASDGTVTSRTKTKPGAKARPGTQTKPATPTPSDAAGTEMQAR